MESDYVHTQFWICRWTRLHTEAVIHWEERNQHVEEQVDKVTAVDGGLVNPDGELDTSTVVRPKRRDINGSGKTTDFTLGDGIVVKVPIDEHSEVESVDQFRNNT